METNEYEKPKGKHTQQTFHDLLLLNYLYSASAHFSPSSQICECCRSKFERLSTEPRAPKPSGKGHTSGCAFLSSETIFKGASDRIENKFQNLLQKSGHLDNMSVTTFMTVHRMG